MLGWGVQWNGYSPGVVGAVTVTDSSCPNNSVSKDSPSSAVKSCFTESLFVTTIFWPGLTVNRLGEKAKSLISILTSSLTVAAVVGWLAAGGLEVVFVCEQPANKIPESTIKVSFLIKKFHLLFVFHHSISLFSRIAIRCQRVDSFFNLCNTISYMDNPQPAQKDILPNPYLSNQDSQPPVSVGHAPASETNHKLPSGGKKNILIGVLVLLFVVGLSGGGWWYFSQSKSPTTANLSPLSTGAPSQAAKQDLTLSLTSPDQGALAVNNEMLIKGKTLPNTLVVLFTDGDEETVESNAMGEFESTLLLEPGINTLSVTAFSEDGQEKNVTLDVVYDANS